MIKMFSEKKNCGHLLITQKIELISMKLKIWKCQYCSMLTDKNTINFTLNSRKICVTIPIVNFTESLSSKCKNDFVLGNLLWFDEIFSNFYSQSYLNCTRSYFLVICCLAQLKDWNKFLSFFFQNVFPHCTLWRRLSIS